jgi:hypothetical protein
MLKRLHKWIKEQRISRTFGSLDFIPTAIAPIAQMDVRTAATEKRVNKAFDKQAKRMHRMSLVSHEADCDVFNCKKTYCFQNEPDRVVPGSESVYAKESGEIDLDSYK